MKTIEKKHTLHWLTLFMGFAQIYAWASTYYLPATLVDRFAHESGSTPFMIMGGFSWSLLIGGLCAPKIGAWIEHEGGRRPLCLGSLLMGCGLLILACAHGLPLWYIGWTVIGFGMALGLFNAAFAALGRLLGLGAKVIIIRMTLISGFATLFWPLTTYLIQVIGWRQMVIGYALIHLLLWAPLYWFMIPKDIPEHPAITPDEQGNVSRRLKIIFYLLMTYAILRAIVGTTISVDILTLFEGLGLTISAAALIAALIGPAQIAGRVLEMFVGRHVDPIHSSLVWTAVLPLAILILIVLGTSAAPVFAVAYGMSNGVLTITMGILPMILFGTKGYASLLGKIGLPVLVAQAIAPLLVSPLLERWSAQSVFMLAGWIGLMALVCLGVLCCVRVKNQ